MPVVSELAVINREGRGGVVVLSNSGGYFGFITSGVADFLSFAHPAELWAVWLMGSHYFAIIARQNKLE